MLNGQIKWQQNWIPELKIPLKNLDETKNKAKPQKIK